MFLQSQIHWHQNNDPWKFRISKIPNPIPKYSVTTLSHTTLDDNAHRRRTSVSFGGGQDIFAGRYMYEKLTKCPIFTWLLPETYFPKFLEKDECAPCPLSRMPMSTPAVSRSRQLLPAVQCHFNHCLQVGQQQKSYYSKSCLLHGSKHVHAHVC